MLLLRLRAHARTVALVALSWSVPAVARAQATAPGDTAPAVQATAGRFVRLQLPGEYMLRGTVESSIPLTAPGSDPGANTLGQRLWAFHWLRLNPDLDYDDRFFVHAQIDLLTGVIAGDLAQY